MLCLLHVELLGFSCHLLDSNMCVQTHMLLLQVKRHSCKSRVRLHHTTVAHANICVSSLGVMCVGVSVCERVGLTQTVCACTFMGTSMGGNICERQHYAVCWV